MSAEVPSFLPVKLSLPHVSFTDVRRYTFTDGLHAIPELMVEVFGADPDIDMAELLGAAAIVDLDEPTLPRFEGVVRHVEQRALDIGGVSVFAITVVARPWLLRHRSGHRIFQGRTALEIAEDVLAAYGDAMDRPSGVILQRVLPAYEYRVQCGETDHDFLFRILAEHGLVSYWAPDAAGIRRWIVTDDTSAGSADMDVPYRPASGALAETKPHVVAVAVSGRLCSSEIRLRDHDHRKPLLALDQRCLSGDAVEVETPLARYSFAAGRFEDPQTGDLLAARRLEQARTKSRTYRWETSFALRAGMKVRLADHPRDDGNGEFLVVSAWSDVQLGTRQHMAEVVPAEFPWRPELPGKPRIQGTQTAIVTGAPGKEIDVDAEGRIAVRFHWDLRPDGASRRVRVAMPWMGTDRGFWTLPRVGDEVVIGYLDGDPDQPLVVGSVNNAVAPPAATLPQFATQSWWKSRSTPGGTGYNAICMEDQAGAEMLAVQAERDSFWYTKRRSETLIGEDQIVKVRGSQSILVGGGEGPGAGHFALRADNDYSVTARKLTLHSTADMEIGCDGSRSDTTTEFHAIGAKTLALTASETALLTAKDISITAVGGTILLKAGGSSIEIGREGIKIASTADVSVNGAFIKLNC